MLVGMTRIVYVMIWDGMGGVDLGGGIIVGGLAWGKMRGFCEGIYGLVVIENDVFFFLLSSS